MAPPTSTTGRDSGPSVRPSLQACFRFSKPKFVAQFWPVWETAAQGGGAYGCGELFRTRSLTPCRRSAGASTSSKTLTAAAGRAARTVTQGRPPGLLLAAPATAPALCIDGALTEASWARCLPPLGAALRSQIWGSGAVALWDKPCAGPPCSDGTGVCLGCRIRLYCPLQGLHSIPATAGSSTSKPAPPLDTTSPCGGHLDPRPTPAPRPCPPSAMPSLLSAGEGFISVSVYTACASELTPHTSFDHKEA